MAREKHYRYAEAAKYMGVVEDTIGKYVSPKMRLLQRDRDEKGYYLIEAWMNDFLLRRVLQKASLAYDDPTWLEQKKTYSPERQGQLILQDMADRKTREGERAKAHPLLPAHPVKTLSPVVEEKKPVVQKMATIPAPVQSAILSSPRREEVGQQHIHVQERDTPILVRPSSIAHDKRPMLYFDVMQEIRTYLEERGITDLDRPDYDEVDIEERHFLFETKRGMKLRAVYDKREDTITIRDGSEQERMEQERYEREARIQEKFLQMDGELQELRKQLKDYKFPTKNAMLNGIGPREMSLSVTVEVRGKTFWVSYPTMPTFAAQGTSEEEALANFKMMLRPMYDFYIALPDARMDDMQRMAFHSLIDLLEKD